MNASQIQGLARWAITAIAGLGAATGWFDGAPVIAAGGAVVMLVTAGWGLFHHAKA